MTFLKMGYDIESEDFRQTNCWNAWWIIKKDYDISDEFLCGEFKFDSSVYYFFISAVGSF